MKYNIIGKKGCLQEKGIQEKKNNEAKLDYNFSVNLTLVILHIIENEIKC